MPSLRTHSASPTRFSRCHPPCLFSSYSPIHLPSTPSSSTLSSSVPHPLLSSSSPLLLLSIHTSSPLSPRPLLLAAQFERKNLVPFFDAAYQGFASGDPVEDGASLRLFMEGGLRPIIAQSFAKNMGLYGERVGAFHVVCGDSEEASKISSAIKMRLIRATYSSPPIHGSRLVETILASDELRAAWLVELQAMVDRMKKVRHALVALVSTVVDVCRYVCV